MTDKIKMDSVRIDLATNGYIVTFGYFTIDASEPELRSYSEDKIVFTEQADMLAWVKNNMNKGDVTNAETQEKRKDFDEGSTIGCYRNDAA